MRPAYLPLSSPVEGYEPPTPPDLSAYDTVFLDTETTGVDWARGDRPVGIAVGAPDGKRWYLPFGHRAGGNLDEELVRRWTVSELRGKRIVGLNLKFDLHMLRVWGVDPRELGCQFHDVAHAEALLDDQARDFSLEAIAQRRLGLGKLPSGPKSNIANEHASLIAPYAERDVELPALIDAVQRPLLTDAGLDRSAALEDSVIPVVIEMEANGAPLDMDLLVRWERASERLLNRLLHQLAKDAGFAVNPDSNTNMARLFLKCGVPIERRTPPSLKHPNGQPSFPAEWVSTIQHPTIQAAYRVGKLIDLRTKYLVKYLQDQVNGVLHPSFNQMMTNEGGTKGPRFSCVRPNLQQVMGADKHSRAYDWLLEHGPEDYLVKRLFLPAEGKWLAADAKQIEYRIFAHYAKSRRILDRYNAPPPYEKIGKKFVTGPEADYHVIVEQMLLRSRPSITRTEVKTFNFRKMYGGQVNDAGAQMLGVSLEALQEISDTYDREIPEATALFNRAKHLASKRGYVKTMLGRIATFPGGQMAHAALNRVIQGTAGEINKLVLANVYRDRKHLDLTMRLTVHDELDADLRTESKLPQVKELLATPVVNTLVPILWDVGTGANWAESK